MQKEYLKKHRKAYYLVLMTLHKMMPLAWDNFKRYKKESYIKANIFYLKIRMHMVTKDYYARHRGYEAKITTQIRNALTSSISPVLYGVSFVKAFIVLKSFLEGNKKRLMLMHKVKYNGDEIY